MIILSFQCSGLGIAHVFEIGNQPWASRLPSQPLLREFAGAGEIQTSKICEPAKMDRCFLRGQGDHWRLQAATNDLSNVPERHSFFGDRLIPCAWLSFLQRESVETGSVEQVHSGPAIASLAHIC